MAFRIVKKRAGTPAFFLLNYADPSNSKNTGRNLVSLFCLYANEPKKLTL